jgi:hypothetical protein
VRRRFAVWFAAGLLGTLLGLAHASEAPDSETIRKRAAWLMHWGDVEGLHRLRQEVDRLPRDAGDGDAPVESFWSGVEAALLTDGPSSRRYSRNVVALIERWTKQHADRPWVQALHLRALLVLVSELQAAAEPGDDSVRKELQAVVKQVNERASLYRALGLTNWDVARAALMWTIFFRTADEGMEQWAEGLASGRPEDDALDILVVQALATRPRLDARRIDRWVDRVTARTRASRGLEMYARLYGAAAAIRLGADLTKGTAARWELMREGFQAWIDRHPSPRNVRIFATHACLAGDQRASNGLLARLADAPGLTVWDEPLRPVIEACELQWKAR